MQVTILTSKEDVKRTWGSGFPAALRGMVNATAKERACLEPQYIWRPAEEKRRARNGCATEARKRFAARPGWGIIRAHGNKRAFESECSAQNVCSKTFAKITRRIQGGNGERPSMEFHGTSGGVSALRAGRAEAG